MSSMKMMKLTGFRVTNFRSVDDSGWIDIGNVTSLIGTNESGKTNLLLPLWKLNPAKDGEINPTADYPRKQYNEIRRAKKKPVFIEARFELPDYLAEKIAKITGSMAGEVKVAVIKRTFDSEYQVSFPDAVPKRYVLRNEVVQLFSEAHTEISELTPAGKTEEPLKIEVLGALHTAMTEAKEANDDVAEDLLKKFKALLDRGHWSSNL